MANQKFCHFEMAIGTCIVEWNLKLDIEKKKIRQFKLFPGFFGHFFPSNHTFQQFLKKIREIDFTEIIPI